MPGCNEADFGKRNFVDAVLMAARETVFTAALGWLLSDQSTLDGASRKQVLDRISGLSFAACDEIRHVTEWRNLDLLVTGLRDGREICSLAIEAKLKSSEGNGQLARYDVSLAQLERPAAKIFLTLLADEPKSGEGWRSLSCADLLKILREIATADRHLCDFRDALTRMVALGECVRERPDVANRVFQRAEQYPSDDIDRYINDFRLRRFAQQVWMRELAGALNIPQPWTVRIRETNGEALLDVEAEVDHGCRVGLELQYQSLKLYASPWPYGAQATPEQHQRVGAILTALGPHFGIPEHRMPAPARNLGFRSYTVDRLRTIPRSVPIYAERLQPFANILPSMFLTARKMNV